MSILDKYRKQDNFEDLEPTQVDRDGNEMYGIVAVIDYMLGEEYYSEIWHQLDHEDDQLLIEQLIDEFLEEKDAVFWSAPKEDFFVWRAIDHAKENGKSVVLAENLS